MPLALRLAADLFVLGLRGLGDSDEAAALREEAAAVRQGLTEAERRRAAEFEAALEVR